MIDWILNWNVEAVTIMFIALWPLWIGLALVIVGAVIVWWGKAREMRTLWQRWSVAIVVLILLGVILTQCYAILTLVDYLNESDQAYRTMEYYYQQELRQYVTPNPQP